MGIDSQWPLACKLGLTIDVHSQSGRVKYEAWISADQVEALLTDLNCRLLGSAKLGPDLTNDAEVLLENDQETKAP